MQGFCYQENTHFSQAVRCGREKFWESVRKDLGRRLVDVVMHRELNTAMQALEIEEILDRV